MWWCYTCEEAHTDSEMVPYSEWNPDARRTMNYLACPCGEREDVAEDAAWPCADCEEYFPESQIEDGTDWCLKCAPKHGIDPRH